MESSHWSSELGVYRVKCTLAVLVFREHFSVDLVFYVGLEEWVSFHFVQK